MPARRYNQAVIRNIHERERFHLRHRKRRQQIAPGGIKPSRRTRIDLEIQSLPQPSRLRVATHDRITAAGLLFRRTAFRPLYRTRQPTELESPSLALNGIGEQ